MATAPHPGVLHPDEETRLREMLKDAAREADAGRPDDAERLFRWVLAATRGAGTKIERLACSNMVAFFTRQGRDVEMLALARRHVELSVASGDDEDCCFAFGGLAYAFADLEDWGRFDAAAARFEEQIERRPGPWTGPLRRALWRARAARALAADDVESARQAVGRAHVDGPESEETPFEVRAALLLEAEIALKKRRPALACEALDRIADLDAPGGQGALDAACLAAECALEMKGKGAAATVVACAVELLDSPGVARNGTAARIRCAQRLGELAADRCGAPEIAKRAYDVAATVILLRGAEMVRAVRLLPELSMPQPDDFDALAAYRARFARQQKEVRDAVARLLQSRIAAGDLPQWTREPGKEFTDICAWCLRVRAGDGTMLPVGHYLNKHAGLRLNHAICGDCEPRAIAEAAAGR